MIRSRVLSIISLVINVAIIALFIVGVVSHFILPHTSDLAGYVSSGTLLKDVRAIFANYAFLTALISFISAILMICYLPKAIKYKKSCTPRFVFSLRFISAAASALTLLTSLVVLGPSFSYQSVFITGDALFKETLFINSALYFRILLPSLSLFLFVFIEVEPYAKFKKTFGPFIATLLYGLVIIIITFAIAKQSGNNAASEFTPYYFFLLSSGLIESSKFAGDLVILRAISSLLIVIAFSYLTSLLVFLINRMNFALIIGYVDKEENEANKTNNQTRKEKIKNYIKRKTSSKIAKENYTKVYHVSRYSNKLRNWKVKLSKGEKAIKVFPTQLEAIEFARQLAKNNNGIVHVHSMIGSFRKF